eukprot:gnl/MRDRNA2_/MRDRNA2_72143_c0_seq2.p1 gnl/MRDRNA2_/MRDRNA2_72143_c0~~gnl/MRDRNA2_/MRDRNA2_72143_c0_seq2.p1  ORF type:complete len:461 (+),score=104.58 gnl/MRDRNA2_/MRDRNA2_72143_c0_seq2:170-1384(+)
MTQDLLMELAEEKEGPLSIPAETLTQVMRSWRQSPDEEVVMLLRGNENECNQHYKLNLARVVTHVNGKPIRNLGELVSVIGPVVTSLQQRLKEQMKVGGSPVLGTGCEDNEEYLEFTFLADVNKDAGGSPDHDPDLIIHGMCATENTLPSLAKWLNNFGALPVSPDLLGPYQDSLLAGRQIVDLLGGPAKAAAILPGYFGKDSPYYLQMEDMQRQANAESGRKYRRDRAHNAHEERAEPTPYQGVSLLQLEEESSESPLLDLMSSDVLHSAGAAPQFESQSVTKSGSSAGVRQLLKPLEQLRGYAWSPSQTAPAASVRPSLIERRPGSGKANVVDTFEEREEKNSEKAEKRRSFLDRSHGAGSRQQHIEPGPVMASFLEISSEKEVPSETKNGFEARKYEKPVL